MRITKGPSHEEVEAIATFAGVRVDWAASGKSFTLKPVGPLFRRVSAGINGIKVRKVNAVCWHGYASFLREVYRRYPRAITVSAIDRYEGRVDFGRKWDNTGYSNMGNRVEYVAYRDCCDCEHA